jgi:4-hydroxybenzoate polyprenyltransferase
MFYRILDYFFLIRPSVLIPCWTTLLLGYQYASGGVLSSKLPVRIFVLYSAVMGGSYILNQVFDIETDRRNKKLFLLSGNFIPVWAAVVEMLLLWSLGIVLAGPYPTRFRILVLISLALGILYSLPPVKLKGRPILDLVSNGLGYGLISFLVGYTVSRTLSTDAVKYALPYVLAVGGVFVNTTIVDREGDKAAGEMTTAILLGRRAAYILALALIACSLITALSFGNYPCLITSVLSLPLFVAALLKQDRKWTTASVRVPPAILALIAGLFYPVYLIILAVLLLGMKLYYKRRFGYDYPRVAEP